MYVHVCVPSVCVRVRIAVLVSCACVPVCAKRVVCVHAVCVIVRVRVLCATCACVSAHA